MRGIYKGGGRPFGGYRSPICEYNGSSSIGMRSPPRKSGKRQDRIMCRYAGNFAASQNVAMPNGLALLIVIFVGIGENSLP